jgi:hypothetical protein
MVYFQAKNPNLGTFWRVVHCKYILWPFGQFSGHLLYFMAVFIFCVYVVYFSCFGIFYHEKSCNPDDLGHKHNFNMYTHTYVEVGHFDPPFVS